MEILEVFDVERINISENEFLWYQDNGAELRFYIELDGIVQMVSKNFYVSVKSLGKYPTAKGKMYKVMTSDGDIEARWEFP